MGSPVAYINHDKQHCEGKSTDKSDGSELSEEETEKMQTDELDKCKAWGTLVWTPTKEAASMASPKKKKRKTRQDS
jgi:hypothetical protein